MKIDKRTNKGKEFLKDIEFNTRMAKMGISESIRFVSELILDPRKEQREQISECLNCYYRSKFGGAAMTNFECRICKSTQLHSSTNTPCYCNECSKDNSICCRCGSEMFNRWEAHL